MASELANFQDNTVKFIPLDELDISTLNVRRRQITADLEELAASMARFGLQQPIVVMLLGNRYSIVTGQRRYLAAKYLGWPTIPAFLMQEPLSPLDATVFSFSENVQRRELPARDKAEACSYLLGELGSIRRVADEIGVTPKTVRKWLGYAAVPEQIKDLVEQGGLTVAQATRITQHVDDEQIAIEVAHHVAAETVRENRDRILDSAEELPGRSATTILRRAVERQFNRQINFELVESSARAIDEASQDKETDVNDIAKSATVQWLEENRYLRT